MKKYWVVQCAPENYYNIYLLNNGEWEWARNNKYSGRARNGAVQCFDKIKKKAIKPYVLCQKDRYLLIF